MDDLKVLSFLKTRRAVAVHQSLDTCSVPRNKKSGRVYGLLINEVSVSRIIKCSKTEAV